MALKHRFVSAVADGPDATKLRPSNWGSTSTDYAAAPTHVFDGGALGSLLMRDTGSVDGSSWLAAGAAGLVLTANGVGVAPTWQAASGGGTPGGSDTQIQFNDGGVFGGDSGLVWNKTNNAMTMTATNGFASYASPLITISRGPLLIDHDITDQTFGGLVRQVVSWKDIVLNLAATSTGSREVIGDFKTLHVPSTSQTWGNVILTGDEVWIKSESALASQNMQAYFATSEAAGSGSFVNQWAGRYTSLISGTSTITTQFGFSSAAQISGAGTATTQIAVNGVISNSHASASVTNAYVFRAQNLFNTGTIANTYGYYVGDITTGTQTNQAWAFYNSDTAARSYFGGNNGFGTQTAPTVPLHVGGSGIVSGDFEVGGAVKFGTHTGIGAETVTGYITITDAGGTARKLAVVS